jgi:hypothetical protein
MSDDRLAEIKARLMRARTTREDSQPPRTEAEVVDYLERLNGFLSWLLPEADWLVAEVERRRGLLARLEWSDTTGWVDGAAEAACPVCGGTMAKGHKPGCEIAAALGR